MQLPPVGGFDDHQLDDVAVDDNLTDVLEIDSDLVAEHRLHAAKSEVVLGRMADEHAGQDMQRFRTPERGVMPGPS